MRNRLLTVLSVLAVLWLGACGSDKGSSPSVDTTAPAAIDDLHIMAVTATSFTLSWTAPGDDNEAGTAAAYDVRYSTSTITSSTWDAATQVSGEPAPHVSGSAESMVVAISSQAAKIAEDVVYYFAVRAGDEVDNWSDLSNVTSGSLAETIPPETISDLSITATTDTSVVLSWTAPGDDGDEGTAAYYDIRFATTTITSGNWGSATHADGEPTPQVAGTMQTMEVVVSSLAAHLAASSEALDTWFFAIKTTDDSGNESGISNVVSSEVGDETAPAAVSDLAFASLTDSSVILSWTAPGDDGTAGKALSYDIRYSASMLNSTNWDAATQVDGEPDPSAAGASESMEIVVGSTIAAQIAAGLQADETWFFALRTTDNAHNVSDLSNVVSTQLDDITAPAMVSDLRVDSFTDSSVVLAWTAPGDDDNTGTADHYDIRYSPYSINNGTWVSSTSIPDEPTPLAAGTTQSVEIVVRGTSLAASPADDKFYFALRAYDDRGNESALSNVVNQTLPDNIPPATITDLAVTDYGETWLQVSWTVPGDDGHVGTIAQCDMRYSTDSITDANWASATQASPQPGPTTPGTTDVHSIYDLTSGTTYYVALRTADESGNWSGLSNVVHQLVPDLTMPGTITDLQVTDFSASTVTISWTAPGDDGSVGTAAAYSIRYSEQMIYAANWNNYPEFPNVPAPLSGGTTETLQLADLQTGQSYYIAIRTRDEADNWSSTSNIVHAYAVDDAVIVIPDAALEADVRSELVKPTGGLTTVDMARLGGLYSNGSGIVDLTGLEYAHNLEYVDISNNNISDLTPMANLKKIYNLNVSGNDITSLSPLAGLIELSELSFAQTPVSSLAPLSGLTKLETIYAWDNDITDLSPLSGMTSLKYLTVSSNNVSDLSPLSSLSSLEYLNMTYDAVSDLSPLSGVTSLIKLHLASNQISDISGLSGLVNLEELTVDYNSVSSISSVSGMTQLKYFSAADNQISDLSPLSGLTNLTYLWLYQNNISDLTPLTNLTKIEQLSLFENSLTNVTPLMGMTSMRRLFLSYNNISDFSPLAGMTAMTDFDAGANSSLSDISFLANMTGMVQLDLYQCDITDLSPLSALTGIKYCDLSGNDIVSIAPLTGMTSMRRLGLSSTHIVDIAPLQGMTDLTHIYLGYTEVVDIKPLVDNPGIGSGDILDLTNIATLSAMSINTYIPALEARGVDVYH